MRRFPYLGDILIFGNIVDKKSQEGYLIGYTRKDFEHDFKEKIDCSTLNLSRYLNPVIKQQDPRAK